MPNERIKVIFKRVFVINDGDWIGSGEFYFDAHVDGRRVGSTDLNFDAVEQHWIDLPEAQWSADVDVSGRDAGSVIVTFHVKDRDVFWDDEMGSITATLRPPWTQGPRRTATENFILEWEVQMFAAGAFGLHPADAVFACRDQPGGISCTTVSGHSFKVRMEFDEVRPTPPAANLPPRPAWVISPPAPVLNVAGITAPIPPGSNLNTVPNPPVIPLLTAAAATAANVALIEYTYYWPPTMNFTDNDARLVWTGVAISGGAVAFLNGVNTGRKIKVYGTTKGEVRLECRYLGALVGTYRALVAPVRQITCRFNILNGPPGAIPRSTPTDVNNHLSIANVWLYQLGLQLVLDTNVTVTDGAVVSAIPGIFRIRVARALTRRIPTTGFSRTTRLNFRQNVMNFAYIHSDNSGNLGAADDYPANNLGATITDNGTPSTSLISPCGIPPDGAAINQVMTLLAARTRPAPAANPNRWQGLFSMYVSDACGIPTNLNDQQTYATTMVHEFGHILSLAHRVDTAGSPFNDNLLYPPNENVMHWVNPWAQAQDFDIIQAKAVRQSPLVPP
jgi:hypothetical protein